MGAVREASLRLVDSAGRQRGVLTISLLPRISAGRIPAPLLDLRDEGEKDPSLEPVQILEGMEYRYTVTETREESPVVSIEPELFEPDSDNGCAGRLRPGQHTGVLPVVVKMRGEEVGRLRIEVRSRKLDYMTDYRWMLRDVAERFAEIVMERFAPTEQAFEVQHSRDAATLYQRFAFLKSLVTGEAFEAAVSQVMSRPYRAWVEEEELRAPGQGVPVGSRSQRELARQGPRMMWPGGPLSSLPRRVSVIRSEETLDTPENRFVKFALMHWRAVIAQFGAELALGKESAPVARGRSEVSALLGYLDSLLSADLFREVGPMVHFPSGSQVLQKRAGYREVFRAYVQFEVASTLTWAGGEDVYGAGQRDVATLYEYWVFLQIAEAVSRLCQQPLDRRTLLSDDGRGVSLKRGQRKVLGGTVARLGRTLVLELWYNRSFSFGTDDLSAWTRPMQPDCSLLIRPARNTPGFEPVWIHFDAKYRVENVVALFGKAPKTADEEASLLEDDREAEERGTPKRTDLLKMHAYRDAIRRSAGAYVIYPGTEDEVRRRYHEILPGLGAFALRPSETGDAEGMGSLEGFVDEVLTHVASQVTQHERGRFWEHEIYRADRQVRLSAPAAPFLLQPPADTLVLLGYVKDAEHLAWIHRTRQYNLRADGRTGSVGVGARVLGAELLVLYAPTLDKVEIWPVVGEPAILGRTAMLASGYPTPRGEVYHCFRLGDPVPETWDPHITAAQIEELCQVHQPGSESGSPVGITWLEFLQGRNLA